MQKGPDNINKRKKTIMNRYGLISIVLMILFIGIVVHIFRIKFVEGAQWRALGVQETTKKSREIKPKRGNIFACDGRLLATSEPLYEVYMDFLSEGIRGDTLKKYVGPLSEALARRFPSRTAAQYKNLILDGWELGCRERKEIEENKKSGSGKKIKTKSRHIRIIKRDINYLELKEIRTYPFWNQRSNRSGLYVEEQTMRAKPFGRLAGRTVGSIYKTMDKGGASGIEQKYDSILRGKPGIKSRRKVQGRWIDIVEVPAEDGWDIITTLDVEIQDITEQALYNKLVETGAESGTAIVMEVETGEIKAISNLDRQSQGVYAEGNPNAFSYMNEPGSTFKTVSMMVALEDGVVSPQDSFYVGTGRYQYKGKWVNDHYYRQGRDRGYLTVNEGMSISSNIVLAKTILKGYEDNPAKYVQHLHDLGITRKIDWDVPLKGKEGTVQIRFPNDKAHYWSKTTLPWMAFGYETQVPPIYMLMFYNGIANNGTMIKPFLTKAFVGNGKIEKSFSTEVINPSLCSDRTLKEIQSMLVDAINKGTGKPAKCDDFQVAGKTGTALLASGGGYSGYYVSFCGYFPADKPKYTIFVGVRRPQAPPSGGLISGVVFKKIAEEIYARNTYITPEQCKPDTLAPKAPHLKNGLFKQAKMVLDELNIPYTSPDKGVLWVSAEAQADKVGLQKANVREDLVPNVHGMGAKDALFALEKAGLRVSVRGYGRVAEQSLPPGTKASKGAWIVLDLK